MCYYVSLLSEAQELEEHFDATYKGAPFHKEYRISGFSHPFLPVLLDEEPSEITLAQWGLVPSWAKNRDFQKGTLNARIETLDTTPSYRDSVNKRCAVLVNGFFEWQWLDEKGKKKQPFKIGIPQQPLMALGALYNEWKDPQDGKLYTTFSIVTTEANALMETIHNTKKRMPLVLDNPTLYRWLDDTSFEEFSFPNWDPKLVAEPVE